MDRRFCNILSSAISVLLFLEALYYLWSAWALTSLYAGAQNYLANPILPYTVWWNLAAGAILLAVAWLYITDHWSARRWFLALALPTLLWGVWGLAAGLTGTLWSWQGVLHGGYNELAVLNSCLQIVQGISGILARRCWLPSRTG